MDNQSEELDKHLKKFFPKIKGNIKELEKNSWPKEGVFSILSDMLSNGPIQELFGFKSRLFPVYIENTNPQVFGKTTAVIVTEEIETFYILGVLTGLLKKIQNGALSTQDKLMHGFLTTVSELTQNQKMTGFGEVGVIVNCETKEELNAVTSQLQAKEFQKSGLNFFDKKIYPKVKAVLNLEKEIKPVSGNSSEFLVTTNLDDFLAECKDNPVVIMQKLRSKNYPNYEQLIEKLLENGCKTTAATWLADSLDDTLLERRIKAVKQLSKRKGWKTELALQTGGMGFFPDTDLKEVKSILRISLQRQSIIKMGQEIADVTSGAIIVVGTMEVSKTKFDGHPQGETLN